MFHQNIHYKKKEVIKEMTFIINQNSNNPRKTYDLIDDEKLLLNKLIEKSKDNNLNPLYKFSRLSNGTINIDYSSYPIGKCKLQGKTKWMMVMKNIYDSENITGDVNDFIDGIDKWIDYIKNYIIPEMDD